MRSILFPGLRGYDLEKATCTYARGLFHLYGPRLKVKLHGFTAVASRETGFHAAEPRTESHASTGLWDTTWGIPLWHPWLSGAWVKTIFADQGYTGKLIAFVKDSYSITLAIIKRSEVRVFRILPRRWVVERTLGWFGFYRRLAKDYERYPCRSKAFVYNRYVEHHAPPTSEGFLNML